MKAFSIRNINPIVRAVAVIGTVMTLVTGVTFAALNSTATLTGNTIGTASATAELLLWNGSSFEDTAPGFTFNDIEPGQETDPYSFYFKNDGNVPLNVTAHIASLPTITGDSGVTGDDITLKFKGACGDTLIVTLTQLADGTFDALPCGPLEDGAQGVVGENDTNNANYTVTVKLADDVNLSETPTTVSPFDIIFEGTAPSEV